MRSPLLASGTGPLAWWRLRRSPLRDTETAQELRGAYRAQALSNAMVEEKILRVVELLTREGVDTILVKGGAVARLFPEPGLRPYGDIDLYVSAEARERAASIIGGEEHNPHDVDLQDPNMQHLYDRTWEDIFRRSQIVPLGDAAIRVLGAEDQLALLAAHFLSHGGWRPLWLCDVAAALENRPSNFDWDVCLGPDPLKRHWIACVLQLAHGLLGASLEGTPAEVREAHLPAWLIPTVLKQWEHPTPADHPAEPESIVSVLRRRPRDLPAALRLRWPDPIRASVWESAPFDDSLRLPYQLRYLARVLAAFARRRFGPIRCLQLRLIAG